MKIWKSTVVLATVAALFISTVTPASAVVSGSPKIIGGSDVSISSTPWQVAILGNNSSYSNWDMQFCGGSLIDQQWVLTAAHCVEDEGIVSRPSTLRVLLGTDYLSPYSNSGRLAISGVYSHPDYEEDTHKNDVALLKLSRPVQLVSGRIETIALPFSKNVATWPAEGTEAIISGWGDTGFDLPFELKSAEVTIAGGPLETSCGSYGASYDRVSMLCAADLPDYSIDTCQGDSGGPLVILDSGKYYLAGVTSWGNGCAVQDYPGLYSRVSTYLTWIDQYVDFPTPQIRSFTPSKAAPGAQVAITGSGLNLVNEVSFGDVSAIFTVVSATRILVTVPESAASNRIYLSSDSGTSTSRSTFTVLTPVPEIKKLSPSRAAIGSTVTITGKNFLTTQDVLLGTIPTDFTVVSDTLISFVVPLGASRNRVTVVNDFGTIVSSSRLTIT